MKRPLFLLLLTLLLPSCYPSDEHDIHTGLAVGALTQGQKLYLDDTSGILQFTRVWMIGDQSNITRIYFVLHGDNHTDYSSSTSADRSAMANLLPAGEGAIVAYPVSTDKNWPSFSVGQNGHVLLSMFRQLEKMTGKDDVLFEQFSLSGGGRVNLALLRLINDEVDSDPDVKEFVHNHMRGIHDGDSLCYNIDDMKQHYKDALQRFWWLKACFIHNTSGEMAYVHGHHNNIAEYFNNGQGYSFGGSLTIQGGRLRFWSSPDHFSAWKGQFAEVFLGTGWTPPSSPSLSWIGDSCGSGTDCVTDSCFASFPQGAVFSSGMCSLTCTDLCPDVPANPETFCITFDSQTGLYQGQQGHCFSRCDTNRFPATGCRAGYACVNKPRHNDPSTQKDVCIPQSTVPPPQVDGGPPSPQLDWGPPPSQVDGGPPPPGHDDGGLPPPPPDGDVQPSDGDIPQPGQWDGGVGFHILHGGCSMASESKRSASMTWLLIALMAVFILRRFYVCSHEDHADRARVRAKLPRR